MRYDGQRENNGKGMGKTFQVSVISHYGIKSL